jgi:2',3'-cyclic-nucleotide 2'-phosphodiesterase (5'-nucleotidase family)
MRVCSSTAAGVHRWRFLVFVDIGCAKKKRMETQMTRKHGQLMVLLLAFALGGCAAMNKTKQRDTNAEVMLISFGETDGELKDCGCHADPKGGLPHRATLIDSLRAGNIRYVLVDAGNFLNNEAYAGELKSRFIWKTMEQMGYFASAPGVRELSAWNLYQELVASSPIRPVATNLSVMSDGKESPVGLPYAISESNGLRVAFFSLIGAEDVAAAAPPPGVEFRTQDPTAAARAIVPILRKQADLVVLMSQMTADQTDEMLHQVPGIDVAIYGRQPAWVEMPKMVGNTIIQRTGMRGMYVGEILLVLDPAGKIVEWGSRNGTLGKRFREQPEVKAQIAEIESEARQLVTAGQQKKAAEIESKISEEAPAHNQ